MATIAALIGEINDTFLSGGGRTKAAPVRSTLATVLNSYINIDTGGMVQVVETGYATELVLTSNKAFTHKKYVDDKVSNAIYDATTWNGVNTIAPSKNAVRNEVEAIYAFITSQIAGIGGSYFAKGGNAFDDHAEMGTNDAFDLLFRTNNTNKGGIDSAGKWMAGLTTPLANTHKSNKSLGNTNITYAEQWTASDNSVLAWIRDDGLFSSFNGLSTDGTKSIFVDTVNGRILIGSGPGSGASGTDYSYLGFESGLAGSGNNNFGGGYQSLYSILGNNLNGYGYRTLYDATASDSNAFGPSAAMGMVAEGNNLFGNSSGMNSTGSNCNLMGNLSGNNNSGARGNGLGFEVMNGNSGDDVSALGLYAAKSNTRSNIHTVAAISNIFWNNVGDQGFTTLGAVTMQTAMAVNGTNQSAAASVFNIAAALGTGNAPPGEKITLQYANVQASGTTRHTLSDGLVFEGATGYIWSKTSTGENRLLSGKWVVTSGDYTQVSGDHTIEYDGTGGHTITEHTASGYKGTEITVINSGSGNVTYAGVIIAAETTVKFMSNGTNWL
jgi:hypothetical protein